MSSKKLPDSTTPIEGAKLARRDGTNVPATRTSIVRATSDQISHADRILIDGLEVFANHGVYPEENTWGRNLSFRWCSTPICMRRGRATT